MGNTTISRMECCLELACNFRSDCYYFPRRDSSPPYDRNWMKPYDLSLDRTPIAIVRPNDALEVSRAIQCANMHDYKTQARSGGHGFGNFFLGGIRRNGFMIDLMHLKDYSIDPTTWQATLGPANTLGVVAQKLHDSGRAMPHGTSRSIGMGGHATVGGIGPMSRMWGTTLDHVVEVEIVTADSTIHRASEEVNSELFWAVRGAASSFGIVTEFVVKTRPEPEMVVEYMYRSGFDHQQYMAPVFKHWQDLVMNPELDRRFSTFFIAKPLGLVITGTFYGTREEWEATGIPDYLDQIPKGGSIRPMSTTNITDWMGSLEHHTQVTTTFLDDQRMHIASKSLAFRKEDKLPQKAIKELFNFIGDTGKKDKWSGTPVWSLVFHSVGGATNDVPHDATAYPHRDKLMMYHTFARGFPQIGWTLPKFLKGIHKRIQKGAPNAKTAYAGFVDVTMNRTFGAKTHYGEDKIPHLQMIKQHWDGSDRFFNPQNVKLPVADDWKPPSGSIV